MKKIFFVFSLFLFAITRLFAQYSDTTELAYLQIINAQSNRDLINNDLHDAISVTDKILYSPTNNFVDKNLLVETAKSFFITEKYDITLFYLLAQRILLPDKHLESSYKNIFYEAAYHYFNKPQIDSLWIITTFKNEKNITAKDYYLLANLSISLYSHSLEPFIYKIIDIVNKKYGTLPYSLQHWTFLTIIGLKEKNIKQIFSLIKNNKTEVYKQSSIPTKLRYKIYRKALNHYIKNNSCRRAKEIINDYSQENLSLLLNIDLAIKSIRCKIKSCCKNN